MIASGHDGDKLAGLPFGPFDALSHRTFEIGLRAWVQEQAGLRLGYVEQLYTFGDRGRHTLAGATDVHVASIGYLAFDCAADNAARAPGAVFEPGYRFFPWEDWREGRPDMIERDILPRLTAWAAQAEEPNLARALSRKDRVRVYFGAEGAHWDEERVLDRYELLYEAGLIEEARRDGRPIMLGGGLPEASTTMVMGPSGTGKTTLGLTFLAKSSEAEPGLLFGFYETPQKDRCEGRWGLSGFARFD